MVACSVLQYSVVCTENPATKAARLVSSNAHSQVTYYIPDCASPCGINYQEKKATVAAKEFRTCDTTKYHAYCSILDKARVMESVQGFGAEALSRLWSSDTDKDNTCTSWGLVRN